MQVVPIVDHKGSLLLKTVPVRLEVTTAMAIAGTVAQLGNLMRT
jgi:hypothetical protein